jgi:hypothetical protein
LGGAYVRGQVPVTPGVPVSIVVGAGGASGKAGGASSFGTLISTLADVTPNAAGGSIGPSAYYSKGSTGILGSGASAIGGSISGIGGIGGNAAGGGGGSESVPGGGGVGGSASASYNSFTGLWSYSSGTGTSGASGRVVVTY